MRTFMSKGCAPGPLCPCVGANVRPRSAGVAARVTAPRSINHEPSRQREPADVLFSFPTATAPAPARAPARTLSHAEVLELSRDMGTDRAFPSGSPTPGPLPSSLSWPPSELHSPATSQPLPSELPELLFSSSTLATHALTSFKHRLLDVVYGTARGVSASLDQRGQVEELVTALEAQNPSANSVTDSIHLLHGRWKLVYTSNSQTLMLLNAIQSLPLVDIGNVYQVVDRHTLTAHNKIDLALPVVLSLSADTGLEVRTPHSFKVRFQRVGLDTHIATPQFATSFDVPDSLQVLGQTISLEPLKRLIVAPVESGLGFAQSLLQHVAAPAFGLPAGEASTLFMVTTYLDETLRISRDDAGAMFVMVKDA